MTPNSLACAGKLLDLSSPVVMGILNVTPDSFSDGGRFVDPETAVHHARRMVDQGAAIIDVGGESTRPGAQPVSEADEIARVVPILEALSDLPVPISVDTSKPGVMRAAAAAGAGLINDIRALREPGALAAASQTGLPICLMHMQGEPRTMQSDPRYDDVTANIRAFFEGKIQSCEAAGVPRERVVLDPGFGFGKTLDHNLTLLTRLSEFLELGCPLLVGMSRKSMFGMLLDLPVEERVHASVAAAVLAVERGATIVRVHDVKETVQALAVVEAVRRRSETTPSPPLGRG